MKLSTSHFPERVKAARKSKELSQAELAIATECTQADVCRFERGKHLPGLDKFVKLCNALGISADSLLKK